MQKTVPVITIDGPSGTGKGTLCKLLAKALGWNLLDSGVIYRALAWAVVRDGVDITDKQALARLLAQVDIKLIPNSADQSVTVLCDEQNITSAVRTQPISLMASKVSAEPMVREAVLDYQRQFRVSPGLITDGRDMGTVVFPDASLKIFLEAAPEARVERRYLQLIESGQEATLDQVKQELNDRDARDRSRDISPLKPACDAHTLDTSALDVAQVFAKTMELVRQFVL